MTIPKAFIMEEKCGRPITHMKAEIIMTMSKFNELLSGDLEPLYKNFEEFEDHIRDAVGDFWDGGRLRFQNLFGTEFKFMLSKVYQKGEVVDYNLSVWTLDDASLFRGNLGPKDSAQRKFALSSVKDLSEAFTTGKRIPCSNCGKSMSYEENKHHAYFAGRYCDHCWETKYKAIEAAETYN